MSTTKQSFIRLVQDGLSGHPAHLRCYCYRFIANSLPGAAVVQHTTRSLAAANSPARSQSRHNDPPQGRITFRQWHYLASLLPGAVARRSSEGLDTRRFVEAVLWVTSTDSTWVDMPKNYGNFHAVYLRFTRWTRLGIWEHVFDCLARDPRLPALQARVREYQNIHNRRHKTRAT